MNLGLRIIEEGLMNRTHSKVRKTVRGVILNESNDVLMVYSHLFDDYTFPGGGIKKYETTEEALLRELKEELGAEEIAINAYIGEIEELRYGIKDSDSIYLQTSYYYLVSIIKTGKQHLIDREILHGLEPKWISINDAIMHNKFVINDEKHNRKGLKTVLLRENHILKMIEEKIIHEKI